MLKEFGRIMDIEHKDVFKENGSTSKIVTVFKTDNEFGFDRRYRHVTCVT